MCHGRGDGEGEGRGKKEGWKGRGAEGKGRGGERKGRGEERDGAIICRNDCREILVCVLIIANLQTCLVATHQQNSMLILSRNSSSDSDSFYSW